MLIGIHLPTNRYHLCLLQLTRHCYRRFPASEYTNTIWASQLWTGWFVWVKLTWFCFYYSSCHQGFTLKPFSCVFTQALWNMTQMCVLLISISTMFLLLHEQRSQGVWALKFCMSRTLQIVLDLSWQCYRKQKKAGPCIACLVNKSFLLSAVLSDKQAFRISFACAQQFGVFILFLESWLL